MYLKARPCSGLFSLKMESTSSERSIWMHGLISVQAIIDGGVRPVRRILIQDGHLDGATARLQQAAREKGIPFARVTEAVLEQTTGLAQSGGIAAEAGRRSYVSLATLLDGPTTPAIFMLDGVEDPYNLGQAIRTLYAMGVTGLVLRPRNEFMDGDIVLRASAGASELMPVATAESAEAASEFFRARELAILAADPTDATPLGEIDFTRPFFLAVGGEKRGLSKAFRREADARVAIPYGRPFSAALGTAAAAGILGYEVLRQRQAAANSG